MDYVKLHLLLPLRVCRAAYVGDAELSDAVVDVLASCCLCNKIRLLLLLCVPLRRRARGHLRRSQVEAKFQPCSAVRQNYSRRLCLRRIIRNPLTRS